MSYRARRELLVRVAPRYHEASGAQKSRILDEFAATTGYARKYAIRLLHGPVCSPAPIQRARTPRYGPAVREALMVAWSAANGICAKRLVPFLPELIATLERHGHLHLEEEVRALLLTLSPATADRLLRQIQTLQDALWRHAILPPSVMAAQPARPHAVRFDVQACGIADTGAAPTGEVDERIGTEQRRRRYRRTPRTLGPRTYRTRPDPFAEVWDELRQELEAQPEHTAKAAFQTLQQRYPGQFPDVQLRTLQRRVKASRANVIVAFNDQRLDDDLLAEQGVSPSLRAVALASAAAAG